MYNQQFGILFKFNPIMQCIVGKFKGSDLVLQAYTDTYPVKNSDEILFTYSKPTQFNKLVKHIKAILEEAL